MVLDILEDLFEGEDDEKTRRKGNRDRDKKNYYEYDEDEYKGERDRNEEPGKKRGFFDRISELFD